MDQLHRIFTDKHARIIAKGVLEQMAEQEQVGCNFVFYKAKDGTFRRHVDGTTGPSLTVVYNGPAKEVFKGLLENGKIVITDTPVVFNDGQDKGYRLIRSF